MALMRVEAEDEEGYGREIVQRLAAVARSRGTLVEAAEVVATVKVRTPSVLDAARRQVTEVADGDVRDLVRHFLDLLVDTGLLGVDRPGVPGAGQHTAPVSRRR